MLIIKIIIYKKTILFKLLKILYKIITKIILMFKVFKKTINYLIIITRIIMIILYKII